MRWLRDLLLGARLALAGGVAGWVRAGLTALGVGLGVAMLLAAASIPNAVQARDERGAARNYGYEPTPVVKSETSLLVTHADTEWHGDRILGLMLQPEGTRPPVPPGVAAIPAPGDMVVSPALAELLASPEGALLRERLDFPVVGTIGPEGLIGPSDLVFYVGANDLDETSRAVTRIDSFGIPLWRDGLDPVLLLLVLAAFVVLLVPVGLFVAAATRFGGEARDRRLAGVRLLGADHYMARRIAAGEALVSALLGLVAGVGLFLLGRSIVEGFELFGLSVFATDIKPDAGLAALIMVTVPAAAVLLTQLSLRRVVIEPLGVARRSGDVRRHLWWRIVLPLLGAALLFPLFGTVSHRSENVEATQAAVGIGLILVGAAALLPWLVQKAVRWLRGGPVPWQLATRRLQLDSGTSARAVMAITVAVAGAIGLHTMFASVEARFRTLTGADPGRADVYAWVGVTDGWEQVRQIDALLRAVPGVVHVQTNVSLTVTWGATPDPGIGRAVREDGTVAACDPAECFPEGWSSMIIADCPALREFAVIESCTDGDVFTLIPAEENSWAPAPTPGQQVMIGEPFDGTAVPWTVPTAARRVQARSDPGGRVPSGVLATPSAVPIELLTTQLTGFGSYLTLDELDRDALERVRNALWRVDVPVNAYPIVGWVDDDEFAGIRRGLLAGVTLTLVLIGMSLLVTVLDQMRERRRVLAGLVAVGTRRRTLAWSILWQTAVPVVLGMVLAVAAGTGVGVALLKIIGQPVHFDWAVIALFAGVAAFVVLAVAALSTPALFRLMRADGLRTE